MSTSTDKSKNNRDQNNEKNVRNEKGKTVFKEEPNKDLDKKNTVKTKDENSSDNKNKDSSISKNSDKNINGKKIAESKGLFSKIGDVFSNVYEKTKEIILPDLGKDEDESINNQKEQMNKDRDKKELQKQDQDKNKEDNQNALNKDKLKQPNQKIQDANSNNDKVQQDQRKGNVNKEDEKLIKEKQLKTNNKNKDLSEISEITHGLDRQHLTEKSQIIPEIKSESQDRDKENIGTNVISGANIPQPDMTGSTKYYLQTLSGHDSSAFDETKRTLPTPNLN
jgi:hypothetical protein